MAKISTITKTLLRDETLIGTVLSHFHAVEEAQKLGKLALRENPVVSFGKKVDGQVTYGHEVTSAALEHARIRVSPHNAQPEYRYFKRIFACDGTKVRAGKGHGLSASAWAETDAQGFFKRQLNGKCNLKLCFPGYTGSVMGDIWNTLTGNGGMAHTDAMSASLLREFPQAREVGPFLDKMMQAAKALDLPVGNVVNTSWSMGAANALASNLYFKHRGIAATTILGDPWRASAALHNISKRGTILKPLLGGSHAEAARPQSQLLAMLAEDVISLYPATRNQAGTWTVGSRTAPGGMPVLNALGMAPSSNPVGQMIYLDAGNMAVLERLPGLGNTHHRTNIINHLAAHNADVMHEISHVAAGKGGGHGLM